MYTYVILSSSPFAKEGSHAVLVIGGPAFFGRLVTGHVRDAGATDAGGVRRPPPRYELGSIALGGGFIEPERSSLVSASGPRRLCRRSQQRGCISIGGTTDR